VLVQIVYPLVPDAAKAPVTVASVLVFCAAAVSDAARVHGPRGAAVLLAVAGGGGLLVEAVGVHTGLPFGAYAYTGDLGAAVLGVPAVVPLAWTMMAWPALVVGRTLARRWPVAPVALAGGAALAAWDLFLDPQMVDAGYWTWANPHPALPLVPGVPLTNYAGWLVVAVLMVGVLDRVLPRHTGPSGPAAALYLWTYGSSVLAHVVFFDRPGSALVGGIAMGALALPFARVLLSAAPLPGRSPARSARSASH
jgi:putative membrane protein